MNISFGNGEGNVAFMSKHASIEASSYLLGKTICEFLRDATADTKSFLNAVDKFLVWLEEQIDEVEAHDNVASKEDQIEWLKKVAKKRWRPKKSQ